MLQFAMSLMPLSKPDQYIQSDPINNLDPDEVIQQPHQSSHTVQPVTCLQPTMKGQHHCNTTLLTTNNIIDVDPHVMGHIMTQLSLKCGLSE